MKKGSAVIWGCGSLLWMLPAQAQGMIPSRFVRVLSGDNIEVEINGELQNVDLANMYPDMRGDWDQQAAEYLESILTPGESLLLDPAWRSGDQLYAYVYTSNGLLNTALLETGLSLPRGLPMKDPLQDWYAQAVANAQAAGAGYYGYQASVAAESGGGFNLAGFAAAIPAQATYLGLGTLTAAATFIAIRKLWRRWANRPARLLQQQVIHLQRDLTEAIAQQKSLERQRDQANAQAQEWLGRAEASLRNGDEEQARAALLQKKQYVVLAESLQLQLNSLQEEVEALRTGLYSAQAQKQQSHLQLE